jgi:molybdopterin/thiamine biosynthesis adenylyltransferase
MDVERFDRQSRTFGQKSSEKLYNSNVYVVCDNIDYLVLEVLKNLTLCGIQNIHLYHSGYYIEERMKKCDVKKNYTFEINPSINFKTILYSDIDDFKCICNINSNIIISVNNSNNEMIELNHYARQNNCKIIYTIGDNNGYVFVDGHKMHHYNVNGHNYDNMVVKTIIDGNKFVVINHNLNDGDYILFNDKEYQIKYIDSNTFSIDDNITDFVNGYISYVDKGQEFIHQSFEEQLKNPTICNILCDLDACEIIKNISDCNCKNQITAKILGGMVVNECIKLIIEKYTPISQFYVYSDSIYKNELQQIDTSKNILVVGCGALGCEWLHLLATMRFTNVKVTDPDHIEKSNLSRQFLFRTSDIGKSKSNCAVKYIYEKYNIQYQSFEHKLYSGDDVTELLFKDIDIVINALDNIEARRYIDSVCFNKKIPLFESGTHGLKCNTQPVIPYLTETYSNSVDKSDEDSIPVCTIKNFPNHINHTIHWARDYFELFNRGFKNVNNYIDNPLFLDDLELADYNQAIDDINLLGRKVFNWMDIFDIALEIYEKEYIYNIQKLLHAFPPDHCLEDGSLFWSNGKYMPKIIDQYFDYFNIMIKFLCKCYNVSVCGDDELDIFISKKMDNYIIKEYVDDGSKVAANDKELETIKDNTVNQITIDVSTNKYIYQEFEKNDPSNYHIDVIRVMANCRNYNYGIPMVDNYTTRGIAGKIIPAVATTTSTVVGLIAVEMIKYLNGVDKLDMYKSWFLNMADNTIVYGDPVKAPVNIINGVEYNSWDSMEENNDMSIDMFIEKYNKKFNTNIEMILNGTEVIYTGCEEGNMYDLLNDGENVLIIIGDDEYPDIVYNKN